MSAFLSKYDTHWVSTDKGVIKNIENNSSYVNDSSKDSYLKLALTSVRLLYIILKLRPDIIVSTGAAPGCLAILIGRFFSIKTVWIDSIANHDELSYSGKILKGKADIFLTQWPHLADGEKVLFKGRLI